MTMSIRWAAIALVILLSGAWLHAQAVSGSDNPIERVLLGLRTLLTPTPNLAPEDQLTYEGFVVDISAITSPDVRSVMSDTIRAQIDVVRGVTLNPEVRAYFQSVLLKAFESYPPPFETVANAALYRESDDGRAVILMRRYDGPVSATGPSVAPVLLHEYMHAYHHQRLSGGRKNADVERLWRQARDRMLFPADSYVLSNVSEYFAMMASVYVYGSAGRDPHTRENLKAKQPDAYAWLEREFGPQPN